MLVSAQCPLSVRWCFGLVAYQLEVATACWEFGLCPQLWLRYHWHLECRCIWDYPSLQTHASAVACVWATQKQLWFCRYTCRQPAQDKYSCGHVITDTWSAGEYEIKLDCAWYYPTAHTHVSAVTCVWAIQKQLCYSRTTRTQPRISLLAQQKYTSLKMHLNSLKCQW